MQRDNRDALVASGFWITKVACNFLGVNLSEYREQVGRIPYGKRLPTAL